MMPAATPDATRSGTEAAHTRRLGLSWYAAGFAAVQVLVLVGMFAVSATPWFLTHDAYPGMDQSGYSLRLKHADCEVLIYGDSSALTGLDPDIIQRITGLKTCNISEGTTIQDIVGSNFPLDQYLGANRRPRYLLTMYTPSIFRPYMAPMTEYQPEGVLYALHYDRTREMMRGLAGLGIQLVNYDLWAGRMMILDALERLHLSNSPHKNIDPRAQRAARHGIWPYPLPPETHCVRAMYHIQPRDVQAYPESVAKMRQLYGNDGMKLLINVAPVPDCDALQQTYRERTAGLRDNTLDVLPIADFNEGDVHFSPPGAEYVSTQAAKQILALEGKANAEKGGDRR